MQNQSKVCPHLNNKTTYHLCPVLTVNCKQLIKQICHLKLLLTFSYRIQYITKCHLALLPCSNKDRRLGPPRQWEQPLWGHSSPCTGQVTPVVTSSSSSSCCHHWGQSLWAPPQCPLSCPRLRVSSVWMITFSGWHSSLLPAYYLKWERHN